MSRHISARLREEAAVACAQMATWWTADVGARPYLHGPVGDLAMDARLHTAAPDVFRTPDEHALLWAEAEALLRTGWSP